MAACTAASTLSETEAVEEDGIVELVGQLTLVMNTGPVRCAGKVEKLQILRNRLIERCHILQCYGPRWQSPWDPCQQAAVRSRYQGRGLGYRKADHVAEEAASVDVAVHPTSSDVGAPQLVQSS